jgi:hypothetical protein
MDLISTSWSCARCGAGFDSTPPEHGLCDNWKRRQHPQLQRQGDKTVVTLTDLQWAGHGWRTNGDALLALSAAARAREHRRVGREEASVA